MFYRKKRQEDEPTTTSQSPSSMSNTESRGTTEDTNTLMPPSHDSRSTNDSEEAPVHGERMSTLPLPSMPWVENELIDEKRPIATATPSTAASSALLNKALPSTPPLSPSSSTSETLARNNSTRSSNSSHGMTATGIKMVCHILSIYVYVYICGHLTFRVLLL